MLLGRRGELGAPWLASRAWSTEVGSLVCLNAEIGNSARVDRRVSIQCVARRRLNAVALGDYNDGKIKYDSHYYDITNRLFTDLNPIKYLHSCFQ